MLRGRRILGHEMDLPGWRMAILQVLLATVDVAVTAAIFYTLLPHAHGLTYLRFLGVYVASYTAGLVANIPGGIGVFDTAMLVGLSPYLEPPQILGAIVVFRLYYYIIPLFLAGGLFAGNEILLRGRSAAAAVAGPARAVPAVGAVERAGFRGRRGHRRGRACAAPCCSASAWCSSGPISPGSTPISPRSLRRPAQFVPSLIGGALMVLAVAHVAARQPGLGRDHRACCCRPPRSPWWQSEPLWIPGVLLLAALLIAPFRSAFYRHARLLSGPMQAATAAAAAHAGRLRAGAGRRSSGTCAGSSDNCWWEVVLSPDVPNSLRATRGVDRGAGAAGDVAAAAAAPGAPGCPGGREERLRYAALGAEPPARRGRHRLGREPSAPASRSAASAAC